METNPYAVIAQQAEEEGHVPIGAVLKAPEPKPVRDVPEESGNPYAQIATEEARRSQGIPQHDTPAEPMTPLDHAYQVGGMAADYLKGAAHGILEGTGDHAQMIAKAAPYLMPFIPPGAAGGMQEGAEKVSEGLMAVSPIDEPRSPEEQLGYETSIIPEVALGGGAVRAGLKMAEKSGMNAVVKKMLEKGDAVEEVPEALRALANPGGLPPGVTEEVAKKMLDDVQDAQEAATTQVLDPFLDRVMKGNLENYRSRLLKLFESQRGYLVPKAVQSKLLGWEGMSAKQFMNYRYLVSNRTAKPSGKFVEESAEARGRRGAYSEILNAMDEHFESVIPPNSVLKQYGEGLQMYKVVKRWDEAKRLFSKGIDRNSEGERIFNANKVLKQMDKLTPQKIRETFGPEMADAMEALRRAQKQGAKEKRRAARKANRAVMSTGERFLLWTGISTALLGRTGPIQSGTRELLGGSAERGHQGMGR